MQHSEQDIVILGKTIDCYGVILSLNVGLYAKLSAYYEKQVQNFWDIFEKSIL